jgi:hypothetical protein
MQLNDFFNTTDYSLSQLLWNGIGCFGWLIAYVFIVLNARKHKFIEMPFIIAAGNVSWEFMWSFYAHPDTGLFFKYGYQASFFLDIIIIYYTFKYARNQLQIPLLKKYFHFILLGLIVFWLPLNYFFIKQGFDTPIGANSGYILNLIISFLYIPLYLRNSQFHFSKIVGLSRSLGTALITVSMFLIYPENYFVQVLGVSCFLLDACFCYLLFSNKKITV